VRIKTVDPELYFTIRDAWIKEAYQREDHMRSLDALEQNLLEDPGTYWYHGPSGKTFFWLSHLAPGKWARLHIVNTDDYDAFEDPRVASKLVREIVGEFNLHLLESLAPAPANRLKSLLRHLGFTLEGRLRRRLSYDGDWADAETYSILSEELDGKARKCRRRRRSRRPKRVGVEAGTIEG